MFGKYIDPDDLGLDDSDDGICDRVWVVIRGAILREEGNIATGSYTFERVCGEIHVKAGDEVFEGELEKIGVTAISNARSGLEGATRLGVVEAVNRRREGKEVIETVKVVRRIKHTAPDTTSKATPRVWRIPSRFIKSIRKTADIGTSKEITRIEILNPEGKTSLKTTAQIGDPVFREHGPDGAPILTNVRTRNPLGVVTSVAAGGGLIRIECVDDSGHTMTTVGAPPYHPNCRSEFPPEPGVVTSADDDHTVSTGIPRTWTIPPHVRISAEIERDTYTGKVTQLISFREHGRLIELIKTGDVAYIDAHSLNGGAETSISNSPAQFVDARYIGRVEHMEVSREVYAATNVRTIATIRIVASERELIDGSHLSATEMLTKDEPMIVGSIADVREAFRVKEDE